MDRERDTSNIFDAALIDCGDVVPEVVVVEQINCQLTWFARVPFTEP